jgi:hypothetical protein
MLWSRAQTFRRLSLEKLFGDLRAWSSATGRSYRKCDFSGTTQDGFRIAGHAACPKNVVIEAR